jgi:hypothetical protein
MMSITTLKSLADFQSRHKKIVGCTDKEYQIILMILKKYKKLIETKSVIDQDIEIKDLEDLVGSLDG